MDPIRRRLLAASVTAGLAPALAFARAPLAGSQGLGVHRMKLGAFEVTTMLDGYIDVPPLVLRGDADVIRQLLIAGGHVGGTIRFPVNTFLVNTGEKLVLVDAGGAKLLGPTAGRLPQCFAQAGIDPAQVDEVCITHMHGDHLHGTVTPEGARLFPNALLRIAKADVDYWANPEVEAKAPENEKGRFVAAKRAVAAYGDRLKPFAPGEPIAAGIRAVDTSGHTPGHTCYLVESEGARLLLLGDLMHVAAVQFPRPDITVGFDWNPDMAREARRRIFEQVAKDGTMIGAVHLPFPGIGRLRAAGAGFTYEGMPWQMF